VLANFAHTIKSDDLPGIVEETGDLFTSIAPLDRIDPSGKQKQHKVAIEHHTTKLTELIEE
jgi:hypothetical protein